MKSNFKALLFLILLHLISISTSGQNKIIPYLSSGAMHHLGKGGVNIELGGEYEILKHLGISANYRYSSLSNRIEDQIKINAAALNLSWIIINKNNNRLSISTGLNVGKYYSLSYNRINENRPFHEKEYFDLWWNPAKIQYDYTFSNKVMIGSYIGWYGDDGDNSNLIGFVIGYKL